ncbi:MAG: DUF1501 domain-containing protein [Planctomycetaceae bacterium]
MNHRMMRHPDRSAGFGLSRRDLLRTAIAASCGAGVAPWFSQFALAAGEQSKATQRHCILLWMTGGPSQLDTFDLKPGHENGGEFKEIDTNVPGVKFSEHLPKLATMTEHLAILRGLSTKEGDHGRGTHLMHTGFAPGVGGVRYPTLGSVVSKELMLGETELPKFVSVDPFRLFNDAAFSPGFLGPAYAPLTVVAEQAQTPQLTAEDVANGTVPTGSRFARLAVDDLRPASLESNRAKGRLDLLRSFQTEFAQAHADRSTAAHQTVYDHAIRLMNSDAGRAFDLSEESDDVREKYGVGRFGQGCLLARRLVERGVPFVEVNLGSPDGGGVGWDTHADNFNAVKALSGELDVAWSTLMTELKERGLLERTTIVWMGEFGRTPKINGMTGRDHFPDAWTCVLAGGGIKGGQAYGKSSDDGMTVEEGKVSVGDVLTTICQATGIDPTISNISDNGRPIKIAEGMPIEAVLA